METYIPSVYEQMLNSALNIASWICSESKSALLPNYCPQWWYAAKIERAEANLAHALQFLSAEDQAIIKELKGDTYEKN